MLIIIGFYKKKFTILNIGIVAETVRREHTAATRIFLGKQDIKFCWIKIVRKDPEYLN